MGNKSAPGKDAAQGDIHLKRKERVGLRHCFGANHLKESFLTDQHNR
jgi:hypothetical protein